MVSVWPLVGVLHASLAANNMASSGPAIDTGRLRATLGRSTRSRRPKQHVQRNPRRPLTCPLGEVLREQVWNSPMEFVRVVRGTRERLSEFRIPEAGELGRGACVRAGRICSVRRGEF